MREFHFKVEQTIEAPLDRVFAFFSDAGNLETITPKIVGFQILTPRPIEMRAGTLIDYSIRLHGVPMKWRTRINVWEPPKDPRTPRTPGGPRGVARFVDEQVRGPYRLWVHEHTFEACSATFGGTGADGSTLVKDHVRYAVPGGPGLETLVERWFVRPRIEHIFAFRKEAIAQYFRPPGRK